jgi:hypothetical protein
MTSKVCPMMSTKRKLPHLPSDPTDIDQAQVAVAIVDGSTTPPRRVVPKGCPADEFLTHSTAAPPSPDAQDLTCDLTAVPKDSHNKRRNLSAIIIAVFPIYTKGSTSHACLTIYCNVIHRYYSSQRHSPRRNRTVLCDCVGQPHTSPE